MVEVGKGRGEKRSIHDRAYEELKFGLLTGAFLPGQPVSLRKIAEDLHTSSMPVRQAVNRLVAERALEMQENRAFIVPKMSRAKFRELTHWRCVLEGDAAAAACEHAAPGLAEELRRIDDEIKSGQQEDQVARILDLNRLFHFTLYEASQSLVLLPIIESLWLQMGPFTYYSYVSALSDSLWDRSHHEEVITALQQGDAGACRDAVIADIRSVADYLLESRVFESFETRPVRSVV